MIIGHLPLGYFTTFYILKKNRRLNNWPWFILGLVASILPDFDFFYQIFTNNLAVTHRYYLTHLPFFYLTIFVFLIIINYLVKSNWLRLAILVTFANIFVHLLVDTVFYGINWLWPFYHQLIGIYNVDGTGGIMVKNYFTSWYFILEILLWPLAIGHLIKSFLKGSFSNKIIK